MDGEPLLPNCPTHAVVPMHLGKRASNCVLADAHGFMINDFGESFSPHMSRRLAKDPHGPLAMRPPEAHFTPDMPVSFASDIWSLAPAIWELMGKEAIFSKEESSKDEVVAQQLDVLGWDGFPEGWRQQWLAVDKGEGVSEQDRLPRRPSEDDRDIWPPLERAVFTDIQKCRDHSNFGSNLSKDEADAFIQLMRDMLRFDPTERLTVEHVLQSTWMTKWALPSLEGKTLPHSCGPFHDPTEESRSFREKLANAYHRLRARLKQ